MLAAKTWPALLGVFIIFVDGEMNGAGGKGKPLDPVMSRTLRRVVQAAELESRSGEWCHRKLARYAQGRLQNDSIGLISHGYFAKRGRLQLSSPTNPSLRLR